MSASVFDAANKAYTLAFNAELKLEELGDNVTFTLTVPMETTVTTVGSVPLDNQLTFTFDTADVTVTGWKYSS